MWVFGRISSLGGGWRTDRLYCLLGVFAVAIAIAKLAADDHEIRKEYDVEGRS